MIWNLFCKITSICLISAILFLTVSLGNPTYAGKLNDFEKDATKEKRHSGHKHSKSDDSSCLGSLFSAFFEILIEGAISGCLSGHEDRQTIDGGYDNDRPLPPEWENLPQSEDNYHQDETTPPEPDEISESDLTSDPSPDEKTPSDSEESINLLDPIEDSPTTGHSSPWSAKSGPSDYNFNINGNYLRVNSELFAYDIGLAFLINHHDFQFGICSRNTFYEEDTPVDDELDVSYYHLMGRTKLFRELLTIGCGIGFYSLDGESYNSGGSFYFPITIKPHPYVALEFNPVFGFINQNEIDDLDISILLGKSYLFLRGGFRTIRSEKESIDSPYIGLTFIY